VGFEPGVRLLRRPGRSGERSVTCDSDSPTVSARAHRGPAVPDAVRTSADQHPYGMAGGRSEVTAPQSRHLAIQLALIVPLKAPAMQAQLAATQWSLSRKLDMACSLGAVPASVRPCASSKELSPGQPRRRARSAPSRPREGGAAAGDLFCIRESRSVGTTCGALCRGMLACGVG
jgi:hypothetical protein